MSAYPLTTVWLRILVLIVLEVGLVALFFALSRRGTGTAVWRRTLCQAALITCVVLAFSELSGTGRSLATLIFRPQGKPWGMFPAGDGSRQGASPNQVYLDPVSPSRVIDGPARNQPPVSDLNSETPRSVSGAVGFQSPTSDKPARITDSTALLWLGLILGTGAVFVAGRACLGRLVLIFLGWRRKGSVDSELLHRVRLLAGNLNISRRVRIVESRRLVSPIAFGLTRATIGLPLNFAGQFSVAKQEAMLTHELAHLAAYDPFWYLFADFVAAILWWHPGIWWLRRQLHSLSELAADEASVMTANGPRVLAECLVEMGAQLARPAFGQLRVASFRSDLGCRVQRLMGLEGAGWRPVSRGRALLARGIGPMALAGTVILCTAWAVPQELTKGDSMKTMKQNWYRALTTFAAVAAIHTPALSMAQENPGTTPAPGAPANVLPGALPAGQNAFKRGAEIAQRYGAGSAGTPTPDAANPFYAGQPGNPPRGGRLEAKLREIVLDEVTFENLPLSEVLRFMSDESRKRDSEKKGINFLLNPNPPETPPPGSATIDPATGLPIGAAPTQPIDIGSVNVRFNIPLRHVTMADLLDAIVRVADKPIQYAVEDYAVIFSLRPEASAMPPMAGRPSGPAPLAVRTFHVDTNTFVAGLESAFGVKLETKGKGESQSRKIQSALRELLSQLNISMEGNKSIFYNELTGTVMVRLAPEDLDVVQAAIETLGGQLIAMYGNGVATFLDQRK